MLASTYYDLVLGLDIHFEMIPTPALVPMPIPNPFIGLVYDPKGLLIGLGIGAAISLATGAQVTGPVVINFMPATNVGTNAKGMGHFLIPPGASWAPMPKFPKPSFKEPPAFPGPPVKPEDDAIAIQGSQTVNIVGASGVRTGEMFMSCGEPLRIPSSKVIAIPKGPPVMVGGPPAVNLLTAAMAMIKTKWVAGYLHSLVERIANDRLRSVLTKAVCMLTGHPVDVATGRVLTDHIDWQLPGPLLLKFERSYSSAFANRGGPLGHGWSHSLDQALWSERGKIVYLAGDGREIEFDTFDFPKHQLPPATDLFEPINRLTLRLDGKGGAFVTTHDGIRHEFVPIPGSSNQRKSWLRLKRISNRAGHAIELDYDQRGNLGWVRDSGGRQVCFEHDAQGRITVVKLPHPSDHGWLPHTRYAYDAKGDLVQVTDPLGHSWKFAYKNHLLVQETDRNGLSFYFAYDGHGQEAFCVRTWGDGGIYDHAIDYDKQGKVTFVTNSLGHTTTYKMNAIGCVTEIVDSLGASRRYEYDEHSLAKVKETGPLGDETCWLYDPRGNCIQVTQPDGSLIRLRYDNDNRVIASLDPMAGEWHYQYGPQGRPLARIDPLGRSVRFGWDGSQLATVTDPSGRQTRFGYDQAMNMTSVRWPDGVVGQYSYDGLGKLLKTADGRGNERTRSYDEAGRVTRVQDPDGNTREISYDAEGNPVRVRDRRQEVTFRYRGMGRLAARTEAQTTVEFVYDTEDRLVALKNERGSVYRFSLGPTGEVDSDVGFDEILRQYFRDPSGRVLRVLRPGGLETSFAYDPAGRVTKRSHSDGTCDEFSYRADGLLIAAKNDACQVKLEYDALGRVDREVVGDDWVRSEYDISGQRIRMSSSRGFTQEIRRNAMGDVVGVSVDLADGGPVPWQAQFERDSQGLEIGRDLPGGIQARWHRDALGRAVRQEIFTNGETKAAWQYTWDTGRRLQMLIDALRGPTRYEHDALGNLAAAVREDGNVELRLPDSVGNLFKTRSRDDREYGPAGQVLQARGPGGSTRYEYDGEGNLVAKHLPNGDTWAYQWDANGMLTKVQRPDHTEVTFAYDPFGRRIWKRSAGRTTHWLWDGNVPLHEWVTGPAPALGAGLEVEPHLGRVAEEAQLRQRQRVLSAQPAQGPPTTPAGHTSDSALVTWILEPGRFAPLAKLVGNERYGIVCDHLGTPRAMFDSSGHDVWSADIDSWGGLRNLEGDSTACPFRWPGQYEDGETGLYYNHFRYYDPDAGEYISQDPIGLRGGARLYAYQRDPLRTTDPLGLVAETEPGYGVYAIVDKATGEPIYVGNTNNFDRRAAEHIEAGRLNPATQEMVPLVEDVTHGEARGAEQALMEDLGTKIKGERGTWPSNVVDSVAGHRLDAPANLREEAFAEAYKAHKGTTVDEAKEKIAQKCGH